MFSLPELDAALSLVHESFAGTPQYAWPLLAERSGVEVWVKHENHTPIGAFKVRGGLVYVERLRRERPHVRGIISATRGNHGQSLAWAGRRYGVPVVVVVPHGNSVEKNAAMRAFGARLIEHGDDFEMAREEAARLAAVEGLEFAPSFAPDLVRGVATWSFELFRAAPPLDALYVPDRSRLRHLRRNPYARPPRTHDRDHRRAKHRRARLCALARGRPRGGTRPRRDTRADGIAVRQPDPDAFAIIRAGAAARS